jgi:hypothetical protein
MMNWKGFGRKWSWRNRGNILEFACRDWGKPQETAVRIADALAKIQTEHLLNTSLEGYHYDIPPGPHVCSFSLYNKYKVLCHHG